MLTLRANSARLGRMTRQTEKPLREYHMVVLSGVAYEIVNSMRPMLVLDPPYQRGAVWTEDQRIALVKSWLMGTPIQAVMMNDRRRQMWTDEAPGLEHIAVIDGKQRIQTAMAWFDGELKVPASWFEAEWIQGTVDTDDGPYVTFDLLTPMGQRSAKFTWKLPRIEVDLATVREEAAMYLLVNGGGTAQTPEDMANAAEVARPPLICDKNDFFAGGKAMPRCLREADNEVSVTLDGKTVVRPVCESCTPLLTNRRSKAVIVVVPLAEGELQWRNA